MEHYKVVFEGNFASGYGVEEVKSNLATLFKVDVKKVDHLFSKPPVVLKSKLDYDSAMQYQKALLKAGAMCKVKAVDLSTSALPVEEAAPTQPLANTVPPPLTRHLPDGTMESVANLTSSTTAKPTSETRTRKGYGDIIAGVVIIGIGFTYGGSVFLGNPDLIDYLFDGLGIFWIGKGIYKLLR